MDGNVTRSCFDLLGGILGSSWGGRGFFCTDHPGILEKSLGERGTSRRGSHGRTDLSRALPMEEQPLGVDDPRRPSPPSSVGNGGVGASDPQ